MLKLVQPRKERFSLRLPLNPSSSHFFAQRIVSATDTTDPHTLFLEARLLRTDLLKFILLYCGLPYLVLFLILALSLCLSVSLTA